MSDQPSTAELQAHGDPHFYDHPLFGRSCTCTCADCHRDGWCICEPCMDDRHDHSEALRARRQEAPEWTI